MQIVAISDTHGSHRELKLPKGDMLIHAGDMCVGRHFETKTVSDFNNWMGEQDFEYKICIAGNHDYPFEEQGREAQALMTKCIYLEDDFVIFGGLKIYGSPWQPRFNDWAFNLNRGAEIKRKWDLITDDVDVLITHGPPYMTLDMSKGGDYCGCQDLLDAIARVKPKLHIFGHIHEGYGIVEGPTTFINASSLDADYELTNDPIVVDVS